MSARSVRLGGLCQGGDLSGHAVVAPVGENPLHQEDFVTGFSPGGVAGSITRPIPVDPAGDCG